MEETTTKKNEFDFSEGKKKAARETAALAWIAAIWSGIDIAAAAAAAVVTRVTVALCPSQMTLSGFKTRRKRREVAKKIERKGRG